jgi:hypothetical protein
MKKQFLPISYLASLFLLPVIAKEQISDFLKEHVEKNVSVTGKYSQFGKVAAFIVSPKAPHEPIYLLNVKTTFPEGTTVKVVGLLHHSNPPKSGTIPDDRWARAEPLPFYYFDGKDVQLSQSN